MAGWLALVLELATWIFDRLLSRRVLRFKQLRIADFRDGWPTGGANIPANRMIEVRVENNSQREVDIQEYCVKAGRTPTGVKVRRAGGAFSGDEPLGKLKPGTGKTFLLHFDQISQLSGGRRVVFLVARDVAQRVYPLGKVSLRDAQKEERRG